MSENNELFPKDTDFSMLVKKARRKSLMRNISVSIVVTIVLFTALFAFGTFRMNKKAENDYTFDSVWQSIRGANIENTGALFTNSPFSVAVHSATNKMLAGVPVPWRAYEKVHTIFGSSYDVQAYPLAGSITEGDKRMPLYFQGERVIEFYHPEWNYDFLPDDSVLLPEIPEGQIVEMAFSFDKAYSVNDVQTAFSDQLSWYWVDSVSPEELENGQPILGDDAYGFPKRLATPQESAEQFIFQLDWLRGEKKSQEEAQRLHDIIADNGETELRPENLKIIGAVVTGSPEELQRFNEEPMIRTAVLGVTANKY